MPDNIRNFCDYYRVRNIEHHTDTIPVNKFASEYSIAGDSQVSLTISDRGFQKLVDDTKLFTEISDMLFKYPDLMDTFEKYRTMYKLSERA